MSGHRLLGRICTCGDWWAQCGNDVAEQWRRHVEVASHTEPCGRYSCPRFEQGVCYCPGHELRATS